MAVETIASQHADRQVALARRTSTELGRLWRLVDPRSIAASWAALLNQALPVLGTSQATAAASASLYVDDVLEASGIDLGSAGRILPGAFAGVASDGRPLASLLAQPSITALRQIERGVKPARALATGRFVLDLVARTQVADAGRVAVGTAIAARPQVTGYVRMIVGKTCSRCLILAGRRYEWNEGFSRHPRCLPAGVVVSGPAVDAATRRLYEGELVILATASGQRLPITGNHPVLTDRGWVPANLVQEGDHVVRSLLGQAATALVVPDEDQVPARVEDLWRPGGVMPLLQVPTTAEDFHGDGGRGEVDVVLADRLLRHGLDTSGSEPFSQLALARRAESLRRLAGMGAQDEFFEALLPSTGGGVGRARLLAALFSSHAASTVGPGLGPVADLYPGGYEARTDAVPANSEALAEAVLALSGHVGGGEFGNGKREFSPRWDAPAGPLTEENRAGYSGRGQDLLLRLSGQVELDRVVEASRVSWSGHVYNLSSVEGWYSANGLIVSNCDCRHIPVTEDTAGDLTTDPMAYFHSLTPVEQDNLLGKDGAEAVRAGADLARVVNARRGMTTADGRLFTTEAAGRRPRLMPEQIFRDAKDRDDAIRLLRRHRYIL